MALVDESAKEPVVAQGPSHSMPERSRARVLRTSTKPVSELWQVHGRFFDVESYIAKHPGGELIRIGQGQDCTALWESVHALSDAPRRMLDHFEVRVAGNTERYVPLYTWHEDGFYRTVSRRVREYFAKNQLSPKAPTAYYVRWLTLAMLWSVAVYFGIWRGMLPLAMLAGFVMQAMDHTVTHDGSHSAISKNPLLNRWAAHTQHLYFWSTPIWMQHHVVAHHSHTGVDGYDPDLRNNPLQRKSPGDPLRPWHRIQHWLTWLYLPWAMTPLQSSVYLTAALTNRRIFGIPFKMTAGDWLRALVGWGFSLYFLLLGPLSVRPWQGVLLSVAACAATQSVFYFFTVVPNHDCLRTIEHGGASMRVTELQQRPMDWGEKQVRSTADFVIVNDRVSRRLNWLLGGMTYQIEHHLFPSVSHCHYPDIAPIVEHTCREFGIPYERPSWLASLNSFRQALCFLARKNIGNTAFEASNLETHRSTERGTLG